jgi:small-conductance mechanosensitive channel
MTDAQRKFLHDFLGRDYMLFTAQDKQDLLEAVIKKEQSIYNVFSSWLSDAGMDDFVVWLIKLSPEATAELICKWKGVE